MTRRESTTRKPHEVWRCRRGGVELVQLRWKAVSGEGGAGEWFEFHAHGKRLRLTAQDMECVALLSHHFLMREAGK